MLAEIYKILGSTEIKTQIAVLKFQSAYHFTIPPIRSITKIGFETKREEPNGLAFNFLKQSVILSKRTSNKLSVCMKTFNKKFLFLRDTSI